MFQSIKKEHRDNTIAALWIDAKLYSICTNFKLKNIVYNTIHTALFIIISIKKINYHFISNKQCLHTTLNRN